MIKWNNDRFFLILGGLMTLIAIISGEILLLRLTSFFLFIICLLLGFKEKLFFNPYILFSVAPLSLSCYFSVSNYYMPDLTVGTWILCVLNIFAFILAMYITPATSRFALIKEYDSKKHFWIMTILYSISFLNSQLESIFWLFSVSAIVCAMMSKDRKIVGCVLLLIAIRLFSGGASKMEVVMYLLTFLISYVKYYDYKKNLKLKIVVSTITGMALLISSFLFATKGQGRSDAADVMSYYADRVEWNYSAFLFLPYMYLETPWGNVDYVMNTQNTRTYGLWMFKPVLGYLGLAENYNKEYELEANSSFNTFTFVTVAFKDFGVWLSIIPTMFLGFFVKNVYSRYLCHGSPFDTATYALTGLATFEMFFSNHFYMLSYPFTMFFLMEIYKLLFVKNKVNRKLN